MKIKFELETEYNKITPILTNLAEGLVAEIEEKIKKKEIALVFPIQYRIKSLDSILDKIENGRYTIKKSIIELQDLIGLRIIILFKSDVEKVCSVLNEILIIKKEYNPLERLQQDQFGYSSIHLITEFSKRVLEVNNYSGKKVIAEIQVRTLSQHSWAEASNKLYYKKSEHINAKISRSIGRISALLEIIDNEYERLLFERNEYLSTIEGTNESLNVDVLKLVLDKNLPPNNRTLNEDYDALVDQLILFNIDNTRELEALIIKHLDNAIKEDRLRTKYFPNQNAKRNFHYNFTGLVRLICRLENPELWHRTFGEN